MARQGKITLYEGTGKTSGKPFTALKLEIGSLSKLHFLESRMEMEYAVNWLKGDIPTNTVDDDAGKIDLDDDDTPQKKGKKGLFD